MSDTYKSRQEMKRSRVYKWWSQSKHIRPEVGALEGRMALPGHS